MAGNQQYGTCQGSYQGNNLSSLTTYSTTQYCIHRSQSNTLTGDPVAAIASKSS